jgi:hypothetical protein
MLTGTAVTCRAAYGKPVRPDARQSGYLGGTKRPGERNWSAGRLARPAQVANLLNG